MSVFGSRTKFDQWKLAWFFFFFFLRSKSTIIPLRRWEVLPEQVELNEEIGRGAFGKVLKGVFRESPGVEVFYKARTQTVDFKEGRTVAVKMLEGK